MGADEVYAGLLSEDKLNAMTKLEQQNKYIAMVADGVNDAPAMARSIAMGGALAPMPPVTQAILP